MSTNKTPNYQLNSWIETDYVKMSEFNENFTTIDTQMKTNADAAANVQTNLTTHRGLAAASSTDAVKEKHISNQDYKNWEDHRANTSNPHNVTYTQVGAAPTVHVHSNVTQSVNGFMSSADKTKIDGVSTGANKVVNSATNGNILVDGTENVVYTHPSGDGNLHVPATGTTNNTKVLKAGSTAGSISWAPVDWSEITNKPVNATSTVDGFMSKTDKSKLDGIASGAQTNQNAFSNVLVGSTTVAADNATDTLTIAASGAITVTGDATNDKVTIGANSASTSAAGVVQLNDTTTSTSTSQAATANAVKTAYDKANSAQLSKITADTGGSKAVFSDVTQDLLAQLLLLGVGMHSFYAVSGMINMPPSNHSVRGIFHQTGTNYGWVFCTDYNGLNFTNYIDNGTWKGWVQLASNAEATATLDGLMSSTDKAKLDAINQSLSTTSTPTFSNIAVTSTTKVTNLNADKVDGYDFDQSLKTTNVPTFAGLNSNGTTTVTRTGGAMLNLVQSDYATVGAYNYVGYSDNTGAWQAYTGYSSSKDGVFHVENKLGDIKLNPTGGKVEVTTDLQVDGNISMKSPDGTVHTVMTTGTGNSSGAGLSIGAGGLTVIGAGESAPTFMAAQADDSVEQMYVTSDNDVNIVTNLQSGVASGVTFVLGKDGTFTAPSTVTGTKLVSNIATGTAPLTVTSTTKVTNLNADKVDGYDFNQSLQTTDNVTFKNVTATGTLSVTGNATLSGVLSMPNAKNSLATVASTFASVSQNVETTIPYAGGTGWSAGTFTAPDTGVYIFMPTVYLNVTNASAWINCYKNGTMNYQVDKYGNLSTALDYVLHGPVLMSLTAGDTIKFTLTNGSASCNVNYGHTYCSTFKVS